MTADRRPRIGVVLEAFLDWPLDRVMPWLREHAPQVTDLEIGAGGHAPYPHCDVAALLASDQARVTEILTREAFCALGGGGLASRHWRMGLTWADTRLRLGLYPRIS